MRETRWSYRILTAGAVSLALLTSCGADLGECDMSALDGSDGTLSPAQPHSGQVLVDGTCANGRCHSADAEGDLRVGAPGDLNFDVVPATSSSEEQRNAELAKITDGAAVVYDNRETMWGAIDSGEMPPDPPAGVMQLDDTQKETIRNWLACGAPVIATPVPRVGDAWTQIYTALSTGSCQTCHGPGSNMGSFLPAAGNACAAHASMVGAAASGPECGGSGAVLVQPNDPAGSLLLQKLRATPTPPCGATMPFMQPPLEATDPALVTLIEQWIMDGAVAPDCP